MFHSAVKSLVAHHTHASQHIHSFKSQNKSRSSTKFMLICGSFFEISMNFHLLSYIHSHHTKFIACSPSCDKTCGVNLNTQNFDFYFNLHIKCVKFVLSNCNYRRELCWKVAGFSAVQHLNTESLVSIKQS